MALITLDETINISFSVKDRHASAKWYETMLGFETIYHADEAGWSELQTNTVGVTIGLGEHTQPAPGNCVPVFWNRRSGRRSAEVGASESEV